MDKDIICMDLFYWFNLCWPKFWILILSFMIKVMYIVTYARLSSEDLLNLKKKIKCYKTCFKQNVHNHIAGVIK